MFLIHCIFCSKRKRRKKKTVDCRDTETLTRPNTLRSLIVKIGNLQDYHLKQRITVKYHGWYDTCTFRCEMLSVVNRLIANKQAKSNDCEAFKKKY